MFLPFLIAFAIVEANQFVDTFWISGLGAASSSAISAVVPFYVLLMSAGMGISVGATTTVAFRLGRGEKEEAGMLASNALILGAALSVLVSAILLLVLDPAMSLMGIDSIRIECWSYMLPMILLSTPMICLLILGGSLRGEGAARKSTVIQIAAAVMNMVLDPILIYALGMGIMGAGLATGLSSLISLSIGLSWYFRGKTLLRMDRRSFKADRAMMSEVMAVGGPRTVNELIASAMTFIQRIFFVVAGGTAAVLMYNYPWRFISLFNLPGKAFESSLIPVGSAAYGQSDTDKMWSAYMYCFKLTSLMSIAAAIVIFAFAEPLMSIMTYEESMNAMLPKLTWCLEVSVVILPFMALRGVGAALLQSMKMAKVPMYFDLFWGSVRMALYAASAYGLLGVDPFDGIIYIMVVVYSLSGVIINALAIWQFRKLRRRMPGSHEPAGARSFIPTCGYSSMSDQFDGGVTLCLDGKYRWVYEMSLLRNATIPLLLLKVLFITFAIVEAIMLSIGLFSGDDVVEMLVVSLQMGGIALLILLPLGALAYVLYAWHIGWYYCVLFEMDDEGVLHAQQENQVKKAGLLADMAVLAGLAAGNPTAAGAGLLARTNSSMYTEFADVRRLGSARGRNVIYVNNNQVYVSDEDFDFVWSYIKDRCPGAKS